MFERFREARALHRIADSLARIATAQEELVQLARLNRPGQGFYSGYTAPESVQGSILTQTDADFARLEANEAKRAKGEWVEEEDGG